MAKKFSALRDQLPPDARVRSEQQFHQMVGQMRLRELRQDRALSQTALAALLKVNQAAVSKLEQRSDVYVSTLRDYVRAIGGELQITARFPDGSVRIIDFDETPRR